MWIMFATLGVIFGVWPISELHKAWRYYWLSPLLIQKPLVHLQNIGSVQYCRTFQHRYSCTWCFDTSMKELLESTIFSPSLELKFDVWTVLKSRWNVFFEFKLAVDLGNTCEMPSMWWWLYSQLHKSIITAKTHIFRKLDQYRKSWEFPGFKFPLKPFGIPG